MTPESDNVSLLGLLILCGLGILLWCLPRRMAPIPLLIATCYMPLGQQFVILGLNFMFIRVLLLIGWCRVFCKRETEGLPRTELDKVFISWVIVALVIGTLTKPSVERFINRSGEVYNAVGVYFLMRCWVRNRDDVIGLVRFLAVLVVPLAVSMIVEQSTGRNIFSVFGGVPEVTTVREGRLRCQGAFRHPILAGTYAATVFPLCAGLWFLGGRADKRLAVFGSASSAVAMVAASSSGPLLVFLGCLCGFAFWPLRGCMRTVRWGAVITLIALSLVMNAPVWFLISRVSEIAGGTGWHRSYLIDQAIKHFNEWWLVGSTYTAHWAAGGQVMLFDPDNMDITNEYIGQGLTGGVWKLGLLLVMIVKCFQIIGRWTSDPRSAPTSHRWLIWSMGVCLFGHCLSFLSVTYFDQIFVMWYWLLAVVSMLSSEYRRLGETAPDADLMVRGPEQPVQGLSAEARCV